LIKPYNSVLGEQFICHWHVPDQTGAYSTRTSTDSSATSSTSASFSSAKEELAAGEGVVVRAFMEQVSHHPPVSAFYYECAERGITATGIDHLAIGFTGTAIKVAAGEWGNGVDLTLKRPDGSEETYHLTHPTGYVNGWLRGSLYIAVCDNTEITCKQTGLTCAIDYKEERWIGKNRYAIEGQITHPDHKKPLCTLSGSWKGEIHYRLSGQETDQTLVNLEKLLPLPKSVRPLDQQGPNESRRVWKELTEALLKRDFATANKAKQAVEETQRRRTTERKERNDPFAPVYFYVEPKSRPILIQRPW
jgi:hypothetical protein